MGTASSMVEQVTLNHLVGGSSPSRCRAFFEARRSLGRRASSFARVGMLGNDATPLSPRRRRDLRSPRAFVYGTRFGAGARLVRKPLVGPERHSRPLVHRRVQRVRRTSLDVSFPQHDGPRNRVPLFLRSRERGVFAHGRGARFVAAAARRAALSVFDERPAAARAAVTTVAQARRSPASRRPGARRNPTPPRGCARATCSRRCRPRAYRAPRRRCVR